MCVSLLSEDLLGQGHPWLSKATKQLINKVIKENKSIKVIEIVTEREAGELFVQFANCFANCERKVDKKALV